MQVNFDYSLCFFKYYLYQTRTYLILNTLYISNCHVYYIDNIFGNMLFSIFYYIMKKNRHYQIEGNYTLLSVTRTVYNTFLYIKSCVLFIISINKSLKAFVIINSSIKSESVSQIYSIKRTLFHKPVNGYESYVYSFSIIGIIQLQ